MQTVPVNGAKRTLVPVHKTHLYIEAGQRVMCRLLTHTRYFNECSTRRVSLTGKLLEFWKSNEITLW